MAQHLYNSEGAWIAYRKDRMVYDKEGKWIGWLPWEDGEVVDTHGEYFATIVGDNRLYRDVHREPREFPLYPGRPDEPEFEWYPGFAGAAELPFQMKDVKL